MKRPVDWSLYLVTDRRLAGDRPLEEVVAAAVRGGVSAVQLREKECPAREFVELARRLKAVLEPLGVPLIINDRVDVALAAPERVLHPLLVDRVERDEVPGRRCLGGNRRAGQEGSGETDHGSEAAGRPHQRREWNATCKPLCQPPSLPAAVF